MTEQTNEDYIQLPDGRIAFSAAYHLKRGYCCGAGCRYCPFEYENVREPRRSILVRSRQHESLLKKMPQQPDLYEAIYAIAREIPRGRVTSYGAIARALGLTSGARVVGYAMNMAHTRVDVPAHRVVNRNGLLTGKHHFGAPDAMRKMLEAEGIAVEEDAVRDFARVFWDPAELAL